MNISTSLSDRVAIVTKVGVYGGPSAIAALGEDGFCLLCHSPDLPMRRREAFESGHPGMIASAAIAPEALAAEPFRLACSTC